MATILAAVSEDGSIRRIRELKPTGVSNRGRLSKKTIKGHTAAAEKGARRTRSPYQVRAVSSGKGVLADPDIQFTNSPTVPFSGPGAGFYHLVMPDISPEKMARDRAKDLEMHRAEVARRNASKKGGK